MSAGLGQMMLRMLRKKNAQLDAAEAQIAALMKQREELRRIAAERGELLEKVAAGDDPEHAVLADLLLTEVVP